MCLEKAIEAWDGKSTEAIRGIFNRYRCHDGFRAQLLSLSRKWECQKGATWLLKADIEKGEILSESESAELIVSLKELSHWEAKLHVLQILHAVKISKEHQIEIEYFIRELLKDHNHFLRAWAYYGFYILAKSFPEFRKEAIELFEVAQKNEVPSVKARIRNFMKAGF